MKDRIDDQINWYDDKSMINQKKHKSWQVISIVAALAIPILTLWIDDWSYAKYLIGILGAFIAFVESYSRIHNFKELWIKYRLTAESLKRHKLQYQIKAPPYQKDDSFQLFVNNCERVMQSENMEWNQVVEKDD